MTGTRSNMPLVNVRIDSQLGLVIIQHFI